MATSIPPVADDQIIATAWGNQVRTEVSALDANKYAKAGGTVAGNVAITGTLAVTGAATLSAPPTAAGHATRKDYVDTKLAAGGGQMTGDLTIGPGDGYDSAGLVLNNNGQILSHDATVGAGNMALSRPSTGAGNAGQAFVYFRRGTVTIGSIVINSGTNGVNYVTTSDGRLKDDLGPIVDPLGVIEALQPKHLRWKVNGVEFDGFIAQEVAAAAPQAAVGDPGGDAETAPMMLDSVALIPYLVGAVQQLAARVAELEAG